MAEDLDKLIAGPSEVKDDKINYFAGILERINPYWMRILTMGNQSITLDGIISQLRAKYKDPYNEIRPDVPDIFNAFRYTHISKIKVIILGQDPYYTERHAHGLAFSSKSQTIPKSLNTIFNCMLKQGFLKSKPANADLTAWAANGVLLLNTALTTEYGNASAHIDLWASYTDTLISDISRAYAERGCKIVWMLWGKIAQAKRSKIVGDHHIFEYCHPAAYCDWSECPTFRQAYDVMTTAGQTPINWESINEQSNVIEAFTDGSTNPNIAGPEAKSGFSVFITKCASDIKGRNCWGNPTSCAPFWTTNIRAEGQALLELFKKVEGLPKEQRELLHVIADCEFWIDMIYEYMPTWERTKTPFEERKNSDLTKPIWELYNRLYLSGTSIMISHVPSHGKKLWGREPITSWRFYCYKGNEIADQMAKTAREQLTPGTIIWT